MPPLKIFTDTLVLQLTQNIPNRMKKEMVLPHCFHNRFMILMKYGRDENIVIASYNFCCFSSRSMHEYFVDSHMTTF